MDEATRRALRELPSVEEVIARAGAAGLLEQYPRVQVVQAVRETIEAYRRGIMAGGREQRCPAEGAAGVDEAVLAQVAALLQVWSRPSLRPVANLSGVVIHTNLGRSPLAGEAIERLIDVARGYCNLEYELDTGDRGAREAHVEPMLTRLTGAEAAFVVNNNAGAVLLLLMALASGREVVVSRGQLVEIGGSFRLPDIMGASGARLVEVGTTNRTRTTDYETAIGPDTALLLRVHTSNYRIMGFTEEVELADLVALGHRHGLLVAEDLGSGALDYMPAFQGEPTVTGSLRTGVDVVCFSGDKLLGGPQAGILVGRAATIERLRTHPAARALRVDKMTLAALAATLELYQDPERACRAVPTLRYLSRTHEETAGLAEALRAAIERHSLGGFVVEVEESSAQAGGGSMPLVELPSHAVRISPLPPSAVSGPVAERPCRSEAGEATAGSPATAPVGAPAGSPATAPVGAPAGSPATAPVGAADTFRVPTVLELSAELRLAPLPVVGRVAQGSLHLDVIALDEGDVQAVAESVAWAITRLTGGKREQPNLPKGPPSPEDAGFDSQPSDSPWVL